MLLVLLARLAQLGVAFDPLAPGGGRRFFLCGYGLLLDLLLDVEHVLLLDVLGQALQDPRVHQGLQGREPPVHVPHEYPEQEVQEALVGDPLLQRLAVGEQHLAVGRLDDFGGQITVKEVCALAAVLLCVRTPGTFR